EVIPAVEGRGRVTAQDIENMVARATEIAQEPGVYATDQFSNPYVMPGHREHIGREIWEQTDGRVTGFAHGIGTASSLMGVSNALKSQNGDVRIVGLEPAGSAGSVSAGSSGPARRRSAAASAGLSRSRAGRESSRRTGTPSASTTSGRSR